MLKSRNKAPKPAFCNIVMTKIYKDRANILEILLQINTHFYLNNLMQGLVQNLRIHT
jgi:hypothetical protein